MFVQIGQFDFSYTGFNTSYDKEYKTKDITIITSKASVGKHNE
jgi:hypothetical protein